MQIVLVFHPIIGSVFFKLILNTTQSVEDYKCINKIPKIEMLWLPKIYIYFYYKK